VEDDCRDGGVRSGGHSQRSWCWRWRTLAEIMVLAMEGGSSRARWREVAVARGGGIGGTEFLRV